MKGAARVTQGQKYITENYIEEVEYHEALTRAIKDFNAMGITDRESFYNSEGRCLDNPVYPSNAELYDQFVDELGFDEEGFCSYCVGMMECD